MATAYECDKCGKLYKGLVACPRVSYPAHTHTTIEVVVKIDYYFSNSDAPFLCLCKECTMEILNDTIIKMEKQNP